MTRQNAGLSPAPNMGLSSSCSGKILFDDCAIRVLFPEGECKLSEETNCHGIGHSFHRGSASSKKNTGRSALGGGWRRGGASPGLTGALTVQKLQRPRGAAHTRPSCRLGARWL